MKIEVECKFSIHHVMCYIIHVLMFRCLVLHVPCLLFRVLTNPKICYTVCAYPIQGGEAASSYIFHMESFETQQTPEAAATARAAWYKTPGGAIFLSILGAIIVIAAVFAGLVGYYAWQLKSGNAAALSEEFRPEFSSTANLDARETPQIIVDNINEYIRPYNQTRGNSDAPIRIVMFIDFECPYCQKAYATTERIIERYGDAVQVVFKHFPITSIHPNAERTALAAACADDQGAFWEYYDLLFTKKLFDEAALHTYAETLQLDTEVFASCLTNADHIAEVDQDFADGADIGVRGTPTYVVNRIKVEGVISEAEWDELLISQLKQTVQSN